MHARWYEKPKQVNAISNRSARRSKKRQAELARLKEVFASISPAEVEIVYSNCQDDFNKASAALMDMMPSSSTLDSEFLFEMFESLSREFIVEVLENCNGDLTQATAFLLEYCEEDATEEPPWQDIRPQEIQEESVKKRASVDLLGLLYDAFPNKTPEEITAAFRQCGNDLIATIRKLDLFIEEAPQVKNSQIIELSARDFPSLVPDARSNKAENSVWAQQSEDDLYEEGISIVVKAKLDRIKQCFPTVDETTIKLVFYELGDHLEQTINVLRDMFPESYRSGCSALPAGPKFSSPKKPQRLAFPSPEIKVVKTVKQAPSKVDNYEEKVAELKHAQNLMCMLFQAASIAASAGNMQSAKKLSQEGKVYQQLFKDLKDETSEETFRRVNSHNDDFKIDLHGLRVDYAIHILDERLESIKRGMPREGVRSQHVEVVTGKGLNSFNRVPKIKPAVVKFLNEKGISFRENEGSITVYLTSSF